MRSTLFGFKFSHFSHFSHQEAKRNRQREVREQQRRAALMALQQNVMGSTDSQYGAQAGSSTTPLEGSGTWLQGSAAPMQYRGMPTEPFVLPPELEAEMIDPLAVR